MLTPHMGQVQQPLVVLVIQVILVISVFLVILVMGEQEGIGMLTKKYKCNCLWHVLNVGNNLTHASMNLVCIRQGYCLVSSHWEEHYRALTCDH